MGPYFQGVRWNAMIHPMLNMTIKGVIWYQGEYSTIDIILIGLEVDSKYLA